MSLPSPSTNQHGFFGRARNRVLDTLSPFRSGNRWTRNSQASGDSLFDDEELEEDLGADENRMSRRNSETAEERRLSRDLEVGFRDDSDDEANDEVDGRTESHGRHAIRLPQ